MTPASDNMHRVASEIIQLIEDDQQISHCRVNIINGTGEVFSKYKRNLVEISGNQFISVRFYESVDDVHADLFHDAEFMATDWFNLFVFNLNEGSKEEVRGVDLILHELRAKFDSKFYATTIVSAIPQTTIQQSFESATGEECPIKSLRYMDMDFDGEEILTYMYKILRTHSTEFLMKWSDALKKLEHFNKTSAK